MTGITELLSGEAVPGLLQCEGVYIITEEKCNGYPLYHNKLMKERVLRRTPNDRWMIGRSSDAKNNNERGWVTSIGQGEYPDECTWEMWTGQAYIQGGCCEAMVLDVICIYTCLCVEWVVLCFCRGTLY